jgi:voltage-gated sodium channel
MAKLPYAWVFFLLFILIATFIVINLFIAVIVDSLNNVDSTDKPRKTTDALSAEISALRAQMSQQKQDLDELKALLKEQAAHKP